MVLTEKRFRLIHYDRSRPYASTLFDIHAEAVLFVEYVLGVASTNEACLGLDTSVQWTIDQTSGKKIAGTLAMDDGKGETMPVTYALDMTQAPFTRAGLFGKGLVTWPVIDPTTGDALLVKDVWHSDARESECWFMEEAKVIPGVVEVIQYCEGHADTLKLRPEGIDIKDLKFKRRVQSRLVMKRYGDSIWTFRSRLELVRAMRDAIFGAPFPLCGCVSTHKHRQDITS